MWSHSLQSNPKVIHPLTLFTVSQGPLELALLISKLPASFLLFPHRSLPHTAPLTEPWLPLTAQLPQAIWQLHHPCSTRGLVTSPFPDCTPPLHHPILSPHHTYHSLK